MSARPASELRQRPTSKHALERELRDLRARLSEAEATLAAIGRNEVDALVVVAPEQTTERVLTIEGAHVPSCHFLDRMRDGALTVAADGTILHTNHRFAQMAGRDDLVGRPISEVFDDSAALRVLSAPDTDDATVVRSVLQRADGSRRPVGLSASPLPLGGVPRIGIVVTELAPDDVERSGARGHAAAVQPHTSAGDLEVALAHVPVGILSIDARTGVVTYANRRAEELLGHSLAERNRAVQYVELTCFRPDGAVVEPENHPVSRVLRGEPLVAEELRRVRPDGNIIQTRSTAAPVHDGSGRIVSVVLTIEDVTHETRARSERDNNDRFRELFIGMLGHDLRDPLATIVTGSALLRRRLLDSADQRVLERICTSAARMDRLVTQLLDFARARLGGGIPIMRASVDLHGLVRATVAELQVAHPGRDIETRFEGDAMVDCDHDRMAQVVSNLVRNALEHGDPGHPVRVSVRSENAWVRLDVHNRGTPIPAELVPFLFDPFRQAASGTSCQGVGLGLYIAQKIVRGHGGTLSVVSVREDGTTFTAKLPSTPSAS